VHIEISFHEQYSSKLINERNAGYFLKEYIQATAPAAWRTSGPRYKTKFLGEECCEPANSSQNLVMAKIDL